MKGEEGGKVVEWKGGTIVSFPYKSNTVKQLLRLLRRHRTTIHKAESVFALYLSSEKNIQTPRPGTAYNLSRPLPHPCITRHNLIIMHSWRTLRDLRAPERVFRRLWLFRYIRLQPFPWEEALVAGFLPCRSLDQHEYEIHLLRRNKHITSNPSSLDVTFCGVLSVFWQSSATIPC